MRRIAPIVLQGAPVAALLAVCAWAADPDFSYDRARPLDLQEKSRETRNGAVVRDITFAAAAGGRTAAYLVGPDACEPKCAAILFLHWYESESPTSNRTQFLDDAAQLAGKGAVSLLVETMWSDPKWFGQRKREQDFASAEKQVREIRRALDVLLSRPDIDPARVALVGHDFGAMYGIVAGAVDQRPKAYVVMAATGRFSNWFLFGRPELEGEARAAFIRELTPLDPVEHIGKLAPAPLLFQFANKDMYVDLPRALELRAAAKPPKQFKMYDAEHGLNAQAAQDRIAWLIETLKLK